MPGASEAVDLQALFGSDPADYGGNSPDFGLQFAPSAPRWRTYIGGHGQLSRGRRARSLHMKIDLKPFDFAQAVARAGLRPDGTPLARTSGSAEVVGASFQQAMAQALGSVSQQQLQAAGLQRELALDNPAVSLEQTMVSMQKAQVGFQAVLSVRSRLVQAYSEIMNMQV